MTRISKQAERRMKSHHKRHRSTAKKTGPKKDNLEKGYRLHENAIETGTAFIPKIK